MSVNRRIQGICSPGVRQLDSATYAVSGRRQERGDQGIPFETPKCRVVHDDEPMSCIFHLLPLSGPHSQPAWM